MNPKNLQDLAKIADLCRKKNIESIKITTDCVEFKLRESAIKTRTRRSKAQIKESQSNIISTEGIPSEDDILFWSSAGLPEGVEGSN